jgi:arylsulfatase A-like enzyme
MHVLVLHASCLHTGFLGCYGNSWMQTPHLDRLAAEGVVFDRHHTDDPAAPPWSKRGLAELLRSNGATFDHVAAETLEETLESALAAAEALAHQERGVCWVQLPSLYPPWDVPRAYLEHYLGAGAEEEAFEPLLAPRIGPIDPDDLELWERLRGTYAAAVTHLDAALGLLLDELRQRTWWDGWWSILTANRGLALGEHGFVGDWRPWLHEEVVHIPLIVRQPHGAEAGRRLLALTEPADVAATLCALCGGAARSGHSLLPLLDGRAERVREGTVTRWSLAGAEEWAVRTDAAAYLLPMRQPPEDRARTPRWFVKPEDRWELNDVLQHHLEAAEEYERLLRGLASHAASR